jgi:hypothetical protein
MVYEKLMHTLEAKLSSLLWLAPDCTIPLMHWIDNHSARTITSFCCMSEASPFWRMEIKSQRLDTLALQQFMPDGCSTTGQRSSSSAQQAMCAFK